MEVSKRPLVAFQNVSSDRQDLQKTAALALLDKNMSAEHKARLLPLLSELPLKLLENLKRDRVSILVGDERPGAAGSFRFLTREVRLTPATLEKDRNECKFVLCHEIGHAIDHLVGRKKMSLFKGLLAGGRFGSLADTSLKQPYRDFQAKTAVATATEFETARQRIGEPHIHGTGNGFGGRVEVQHSASSDGKTETVIQQKLHLTRSTLGKLGGAAIMAGLGSVGGLAAAGLLLACGGAEFAKSNRLFQGSEHRFADQGGSTEVISRGRTSVVRTSGPSAPRPEVSWSTGPNYIAETDTLIEFMAEGLGAYMTSPETQEKLRQQEGILHNAVENTLLEYMFGPAAPGQP